MKSSIILIALAVISFLASSADSTSYSLIERSLPLVLGASLGGVLACTSIIVGVLSASSKDTKKKAKQSDSFSKFIESLETDVKVLVVCLFLLLPCHTSVL